MRRNELVRIYLVNVTEFDKINSMHIHGNFFHVYRTGTRLEASEFTDLLMLCQAERAILEVRFPFTGRFMFHASEFAELGGWVSLRWATTPSRDVPVSMALGGQRTARMWVYGLLPLAMLVVLGSFSLHYGTRGVFRAAYPPVEALTIDRVTLPPGRVEVSVTNGGPSPVTGPGVGG